MTDILPEDTINFIRRRYAGTGQIEELCRSHEELRRQLIEAAVQPDVVIEHQETTTKEQNHANSA